MMTNLKNYIIIDIDEWQYPQRKEYHRGAQNMEQQEVIVIGAGFSGLACAYELVAAGHKVKILEARNRVGAEEHQFMNLLDLKY